MSNAISNISSALGYDAVEALLASGGSLANAYALASIQLESLATNYDGPSSVRATECVATVKPGKAG